VCVCVCVCVCMYVQRYIAIVIRQIGSKRLKRAQVGSQKDNKRAQAGSQMKPKVTLDGPGLAPPITQFRTQFFSYLPGRKILTFLIGGVVGISAQDYYFIFYIGRPMDLSQNGYKHICVYIYIYIYMHIHIHVHI
jgi:hypothetical protein